MITEYRAGKISRAGAFKTQEALMKTVAKLDDTQALSIKICGFKV